MGIIIRSWSISRSFLLNVPQWRYQQWRFCRSNQIINRLFIVFSKTFGVLMMMDVMECFLHALCLHWVEFQSKFFKADCYAFQKCSYFKIMEENAGPKE